MHWFSWERLCDPKCEGGLGFREISFFNQALLAKQVWRLLQNPSSLAYRVLRGKYFVGENILRGILGSSLSYIWKSLFWGMELLDKGLVWRIEDGVNVNVKSHNWVPRPISFKPLVLNFAPSTNVALFILPNRSWNIPLLEASFLPIDVSAISAIHLSPIAIDDSLYLFF